MLVTPARPSRSAEKSRNREPPGVTKPSRRACEQPGVLQSATPDDPGELLRLGISQSITSTGRDVRPESSSKCGGTLEEMTRHKRVSVTEARMAHSERLHRRQRWYFALMGLCLLLIVLAWNVVRLWSTTAAVAMSAVAAVIPPIAVIVANWNGDR